MLSYSDYFSIEHDFFILWGGLPYTLCIQTIPRNQLILLTIKKSLRLYFLEEYRCLHGLISQVNLIFVQHRRCHRLRRSVWIILWNLIVDTIGKGLTILRTTHTILNAYDTILNNHWVSEILELINKLSFGLRSQWLILLLLFHSFKMLSLHLQKSRWLILWNLLLLLLYYLLLVFYRIILSSNLVHWPGIVLLISGKVINLNRLIILKAYILSHTINLVLLWC